MADRPSKNEIIYRRFVDAVADYAIFAMDRHGIILTWNLGAKRLKGYEASEVIGTHFSRFYTPEDLKRNHPAWELEFASQNGKYEEEGWRVRKDGSRFWANVVITALKDENGEVTGFAKVTRDLTQRKATEEKLRQSEERLQTAYAELEKRVQERTAELQTAKEQAESAVRARDEFFSIASHELRTPLTSLRLKSEIAKRALTPDLLDTASGQKLAKFVDDMQEQLKRLTKLVSEMLDLTRLSQGRLPLELEKADLNAIVRNAIECMLPQLKEAGNEIRVQYSETIVIHADPLRIEQVLLNLLTNAIRYAPRAPVSVFVTCDGGWAQVIVKDEGPGIPSEKHEQIFRRFERLSAMNSVGGLGIGLYLARAIVQSHSGTLRVESEPGRGASFLIRIPLAESLPSERSRPVCPPKSLPLD